MTKVGNMKKKKDQVDVEITGGDRVDRIANQDAFLELMWQTFS